MPRDKHRGKPVLPCAHLQSQEKAGTVGTGLPDGSGNCGFTATARKPGQRLGGSSAPCPVSPCASLWASSPERQRQGVPDTPRTWSSTQRDGWGPGGEQMDRSRFLSMASSSLACVLPFFSVMSVPSGFPPVRVEASFLLS